MTLQELRDMAIERGLELPPCINKVELVRLMQRAEGNLDCFATKRRLECPELGCLWRHDCAKLQVPDAANGMHGIPGFHR
jgi:hypothetical protein